MSAYTHELLKPYTAFAAGEETLLPLVNDRIMDAVKLRQFGYFPVAGVIAASREDLPHLLAREFGIGGSLHKANEAALDGLVVYGPYVTGQYETVDTPNQPPVFAPNNSIALWQAPEVTQ